jgi:CheY-like chemotaxis protein
MSKIYNGTAVPRYAIFATPTGDFVVQLTGSTGHDLLTGELVSLDGSHSGRPLTDPELEQLRAAGRVEHYNRVYVWLLGLPEPHIYDPSLASGERKRPGVRMYYLDTHLLPSSLDMVNNIFHEQNVAESLTTEILDGRIVVKGEDQALFPSFDTAQAACRWLVEVSPLFENSSVAFTLVDPRESALVHEVKLDDADLNLIIASQTDVTATEGKRVIAAVPTVEDQEVLLDLCRELHIEALTVSTGSEALELLEDIDPDLLIMELQLPDMHGWEMLSKLKEVDTRSQFPIIMVANHSESNKQSLALSVAKVDVFLVRPVSRARLRQNIWMALKARA